MPFLSDLSNFSATWRAPGRNTTSAAPCSVLQHRFFTGIDWQHQIDDRKNFDNVNGRPGATELLNQDETVTALGFFMQDEVHLTPRWSVLLGGRYDNVRFDIDDRRLIDTSDSGTRTFDQFTGRSGVMYALRPGIRLYGNVAQSFETPTSTELVNRPQGGGGINTDIQPQRATNYEIGMKTRAGRDFTLDAAFFLIELKDELIAFRDATDRVFYRNAGESRRLGAELGMTRRLAQGLTLHLAYTFLETEFRSYKKEGVDLAGNEVPGLPRHRLFGELHYAHAGGIYAAGNVHHVGAFYVDEYGPQFGLHPDRCASGDRKAVRSLAARSLFRGAQPARHGLQPQRAHQRQWRPLFRARSGKKLLWWGTDQSPVLDVPAWVI
jgi:iron complex outermembrane recepter protein